MWCFEVPHTLLILDVPHLEQRPLDAQDLHGISTGEDLQRVRSLAHRLYLLVDLRPDLKAQR